VEWPAAFPIPPARPGYSSTMRADHPGDWGQKHTDLGSGNGRSIRCGVKMRRLRHRRPGREAKRRITGGVMARQCSILGEELTRPVAQALGIAASG